MKRFLTTTLILFWTGAASAVFQPYQAKRDGLINHLQPRPLRDHITELKPHLAYLPLQLPPELPRVQVDPLEVKDNETQQEYSFALLQSFFNAAFAHQSPEEILKKRNLFFGYDDSLLHWEVQRSALTEPITPLFAVGVWGEEGYTFDLAPELKTRPVFRAIVLLTALMEADLRHAILRRFGGAILLREHFPKLQALGHIMSSIALWNFASQIPVGVLRDELEQQPQTKTPAMTALRELLWRIEQMQSPIGWVDQQLHKIISQNPESERDVVQLTVELMQKYSHSRDGVWNLTSFTALQEKMRPSLQEWWGARSAAEREQLRPRIYARKDYLVASSVVAQEICDNILKSK